MLDDRCEHCQYSYYCHDGPCVYDETEYCYKCSNGERRTSGGNIDGIYCKISGKYKHKYASCENFK